MNIISLILKKYNEKFDENENNEIIYKNNIDFKKLLLEIDKVEKETKCLTDNKELFFSNKNITSIHEMNFIQDINLVTKIVKHRKLEIKKQIRIISLAIEVYKYILIQIKCVDFKLELNKIALFKDRSKCVEIFNTAIFNNSYFLQDTLCRYIDLEEKLKSLS